MAKKSKPSKPMRRTLLAREQLLPIAPAKARTLSLKSHLALAALRQGHGKADLASELLKTLYLTFLANVGGDNGFVRSAKMFVGKPDVLFDAVQKGKAAQRKMGLTHGLTRQSSHRSLSGLTRGYAGEQGRLCAEANRKEARRSGQ